MSYEPVLDNSGVSNVAGEHLFHVRVLFGSSVITSYRSKDVTIARNSAGNYTLTFPKVYNEITRFSAGMVDASGAVLFWCITTNAIDTAGTMVLECRTEAGTATDPTSGDYAYLSVGVSCDLLNNQYVG